MAMDQNDFQALVVGADWVHAASSCRLVFERNARRLNMSKCARALWLEALRAPG
jgi:hypothetical protein